MDNQSSFTFDSDPGVMYKLGNIEAQLNAINQKLDQKETAQDKAIESLNARTGRLEMWRNVQIGAAAVISAIIGVIIKVWP